MEEKTCKDQIPQSSCTKRGQLEKLRSDKGKGLIRKSGHLVPGRTTPTGISASDANEVIGPETDTMLKIFQYFCSFFVFVFVFQHFLFIKLEKRMTTRAIRF